MWISIEIFSIDYVDTFKMEIGLTFNMRIQWKDPRLRYSNILHAPYGKEEVRQVLGNQELFVLNLYG